MEPQEVGRRIKHVRQDRGLTLKAVEASSGVSATHVSEIERGAASPTVGALSRIARALGKRPGYFLEENEMSDVSAVARQDRVRESAAAATALERLTTGIPGGRVQVVQVTLAPGRSHRSAEHAHDGVEVIAVIRGRVAVTVAAESHDLGPGDAITFDASRPHAYSNGSRDEPAVLVWVASRRDVL
jgi:transcriptional regulator with XRE-family HTH domain